MTINRSLWLDTFSENRIPEWFCPTCKKGFLKLSDNGLIYGETSDTVKKEESNNYILFDGIYKFKYRFSIFLKCSNEDCQEIVVGCGKGFVVEEYTDWVEALEEYAPEPVLVFSPMYFFPPLDLFSVPVQCPDIVTKEIFLSFSLFFADPPASANYVRKAVETILTAKKVKRYTINKKRRREKISLHDRIIKFKQTHPEIAQKLLAVKWLGNEGSHSSNIKKNDVLDAYEILEVILDDLFVGYRKAIDKKVSLINQQKKPLHPST